MKYLKTTLLFAVILGAGYFLYSKYLKRSVRQEIILSEEFEENKKKPLDPGGIVMSNSSSLIYEKLNPVSSKPGAVNLAPDPEEPMKLDFKTDVAVVAESSNAEDYDSIDDILAKLELPVSQEVVLDSNGIMPEATEDNSGEQSLIAPSGDPETLEIDETQESKNQINEGGKAVGGIKITNLPGSNKVYNLNSSPADAGYKIQLSSAWSEKEAKNEWKRIQARHMKYLKNAELIIKKVKTNEGKIIYLVMAGNFPALNQAKLICKKLSQSKQNCIVTK